MKKVWINGNLVSSENILTGSWTAPEKDPFDIKVLELIRDWELGKKKFEFRTSGTTGSPKTITIEREKMELSARSTLGFLSITEGNCLLCLDPGFIAGAMMVIRAMEGGLNLYAVTPSSDPMKEIPKSLDFVLCALVPLQLQQIILDPVSTLKLAGIRNVLIGGADIPTRLVERISQLPNPVYHTFGMTETVTHIALRRLNGRESENYFRAVPGVEFFTDERNCLVIKGDITGQQPLITNDRVDLIAKDRFRWLGRIDNVINSGGIKIQLETLEKRFLQLFEDEGIRLPFFLAGMPDRKLGQKLTIVFETSGYPLERQRIADIFSKNLVFHEIPREWRSIDTFIGTESGKTDRLATLKASVQVS